MSDMKSPFGTVLEFDTLLSRCIFCDSERSVHSYDAVFESVKVVYHICIACGSFFQNPPLTKQSLKGVYNSNLYWGVDSKDNYIYDSYDKQAEQYSKDGGRRALIIESTSNKKFGASDKILEIGCGAGFSSLPFIRRGCEVIGIEPSERLSSIASEKYGLKMLTGMFEDMDIPENSFDLAYSWGTSMNFQNPSLIYSKVAKLIKPHGFFFMDFFDMGSPFRFLTWRKRKKGIHISGAPSKSGIIKSLHKSGFVDVEFHRFFPFFSLSFIASQLDIPIIKKLFSIKLFQHLGIYVPVPSFYVVSATKGSK